MSKSLFRSIVLVLKVRIDALIDDIGKDKQVALRCLERPEYHKYLEDKHFRLDD